MGSWPLHLPGCSEPPLPPHRKAGTAPLPESGGLRSRALLATPTAASASDLGEELRGCSPAGQRKGCFLGDVRVWEEQAGGGGSGPSAHLSTVPGFPGCRRSASQAPFCCLVAQEPAAVGGERGRLPVTQAQRRKPGECFIPTPSFGATGWRSLRTSSHSCPSFSSNGGSAWPRGGGHRLPGQAAPWGTLPRGRRTGEEASWSILSSRLVGSVL